MTDRLPPRTGLLLALLSAVLPALASPARPAELRIGMAAPATTADPHFHADAANFALHRHVFEALLRWTPDGQLRPMLAQGWAALPGGDGWAVRLDPAARFADGTPVTADDVAASLRRAMTIPNSPARYTPFLLGLRRVEVAGPGLLHLHTTGPGPLLPNGLTTLLVVPERIAATASPADFNSGAAALGSGPYRLRQYRPGEGALLERNPDWWQARRPASPLPLPEWERVSLRTLPQDGARVAALLAGDVELIEAVPLRDAPRLARTPGLRMARQDGTRVMYLLLNPSASAGAGGGDGAQVHPQAHPLAHPLADARVRRALSLALDRGALAARVMDGAAEPAGQILPPDRPAADPTLRPEAQDRAMARRLLEEAGWGQGLALTLTGTANRFPNDEALLQAVAQMWQQAGIAAQVEPLPAALFFPRLAGGQFTTALFGWLTGPGEPNAVLGAVLGTRDPARSLGSLNGTGYSNPRLDGLITTALATGDTARRLAMWQEAARLVVRDEVALIPLLHLASLWAMRQEIRYAPRGDSLTQAMDAYTARP
ncbi:ABC transporter substrate-binding protein [Roseomonas sp. GC11]|uniref:ABC transporter substrate-binding protein n=1 Tax=Roseomonas sp. GC11 TaxID=2950546 RepID=UPI0021098DD7|nr:ABC transporter substrate-binding protein [Roseomonas sp. GC11]MCQ4158606.1 ABC transporter substrate-binding protein [Roseomonas sp. GC11]